MKAKRDQKRKNRSQRRFLRLMVAVIGLAMLLLSSLLFHQLQQPSTYHVAYATACDVMVIELPDLQRTELATSDDNTCRGRHYDWPEQQLTFYRVRDQLLVVPWDDTQRRNLAEAIPEDAFNAVFSPDGDEIIFWRVVGADEQVLHRLSYQGDIADTVDYGPLPFGHSFASWSPNEDILAFSLWEGDVYPQLAILDLTTGEVTQLTDTSYYNTSPTFSPDGTQLAYTSIKTGYARLYVMDVATGESHIVSEEGFGFSPAWSPDGEKIAFTSNHESYFSDLYVVDKDGSNFMRLTDSKTYDGLFPIWVKTS